jgi:putative acetyltransferase
VAERSEAADVLIRAERDDDRAAISDLQTRAFADDGRVAGLVDALRAANAPLKPLSFVAEVGRASAGQASAGQASAGQATAGRTVAGHVMLSASRLDAPRRIVDVYVLSPLGVDPEFQRNGIGTRLISHAVGAAEAAGVPLVFLEGSPSYYGKRGFESAEAAGFRSPSLRIPPSAFQVVRLAGYEPWMTGTLVYSETFWALDCVGLRDPAPA